MNPTRGRDKNVCLAITLVGALALAGCATMPESETATASMPSTISQGTTLAAGRVAQAGVPGSELAQGAGESMKPVYGDDTLFLIAPIAWEDLQPGMHIAYTDPFGNQIVHALLYKRDGYWVVEGINNDNPDRYHVTQENLVGVVYGTFQADKPFENSAK